MLSRSRLHSLALGGFVIAAGLVAVEPVLAACTDPAMPGVAWRRCYFEERDFIGVNLSGAVLRDTRFHRANLSGANLAEVDAFRTKFVTATLTGVIFDRARLTEADFTKADLTGASFKGADLRRARLFRAILRNADFSKALMRGADLLKADLSGARWTDGRTICAEGSIGQCNAARTEGGGARLDTRSRF